ncbi:hypothetical protein LPJ56_000344 [Coemansia sp. RSA 2599]|nr:hypothetical protein LPJ75_000142 [Coemansia sp. RSA 2598]KAJ1829402.1 hypothetical protein LPJ56_000344 [Coemansia sp. RSA 2599]
MTGNKKHHNHLRLSLEGAQAYSGADGFPAMPPSPVTASYSDSVSPLEATTPTTLTGVSTNPIARPVRSSSTHSATSVTTAVNGAMPSLKYASSSICISPSGRLSSRINLEGSWLDLESDSEDDRDGTRSMFRGRLTHSRRKSSLNSNSSNSSNSGGIGLSANLKELTRRSSMHFRKLTSKMSGVAN